MGYYEITKEPVGRTLQAFAIWCVKMNVGLILSGGMAKGAYQIGALKAIADYVPKTDIKCISCASIGVLNGYAYITDALSQAEVLWKSICNDGCRFFVNQILKSSLLQQGISTLYNPDKTIVPSFYCSLLGIIVLFCCAIWVGIGMMLIQKMGEVKV